MTSSTEPVETELKFALGPGARTALEAGLFHGAATSELSATYFDTDDLALFGHGYGLRVRRKGERFVQTLKSQGDGLFARGEWEADVHGPTLDAAALASTPAARIATLDGLIPVFAVEVRRTVAVVTHGAARIEASLDIGQVIAGDSSETVEELELELIEGTPADLFAFARTLDADLILTFATKSERGYRLARNVTADIEGHPASLRRLSAAIIHEDAESAASAAAALGVAFGRHSGEAFDRAAWARILLNAAEGVADIRV